MTDARELGTVTDYASLHQIMRARAEELKLSRSTIDRLAGLASGHAGKLLAPRPIKKAKDETLQFLLPALGIKLIAVVDPDAVDRIKRTSEPRTEGHDLHAVAVHYTLSRRFLRRIGKKGGQNSRKYMSARERRRLARKAGLARWRKPTVTEVAV